MSEKLTNIDTTVLEKMSNLYVVVKGLWFVSLKFKKSFLFLNKYYTKIYVRMLIFFNFQYYK